MASLVQCVRGPTTLRPVRWRKRQKTRMRKKLSKSEDPRYDLCKCGSWKAASARDCWKCWLKRPKRGALHHNWKGNDVTRDSGRDRARRWYPMGKCIRCGRDGKDRHHKNGDTLNNDPSNIEILCRRCHTTVDGRAAQLAECVRQRPIQPPKPCQTCGQLSKPHRHGECKTCAHRTWSRKRRQQQLQDAA